MRTARYRAEAEANLLRDQLAEERRKAAPSPAPAPAPEKPEPTGKPVLQDFINRADEYGGTYEGALEAFHDARDKWNRLDWKREQDDAARQVEQGKLLKQAEEKSAKLKDGWEARESLVKAKHPEYEAHFEAFLKVAQTNPELAAAVFESEIGPDLAQHLGATEAELTRIAALEPRFLARAIGVLEHTLAEKEKGSTAKITEAPRPLAAITAPASRPAKATSIEDRLYPDQK